VLYAKQRRIDELEEENAEISDRLDEWMRYADRAADEAKAHADAHVRLKDENRVLKNKIAELKEEKAAAIIDREEARNALWRLQRKYARLLKIAKAVKMPAVRKETV